MKKILYILLIFIAAGCTHNNGDIGDWFGMWKLESVKTGNDVVEVGDRFMSFQNQVVGLLSLDNETSVTTSYGLFEEKNDSLFFTLRQGNTSVYNRFDFVPVSQMNDNINGSNVIYYSFEFEILRLTSNKLLLKYDEKEYSFRKH